MKTNFREVLNESYEERSLVNPGYSLRAFARDLGISPSTLSEIRNGKKGLSQNLAQNVAQKLRLPDWQIRFFCDLVASEHAKCLKERRAARRRVKSRKLEHRVHTINQMAMKALTSWLELAILEITHVNGFQPSIPWIAAQLDVDEARIRSAVKRLEETQLLDINPVSGKWIDVSPLFSSTDGLPNESIRNFHRSVLQLALKKLDDPDVTKRTVKTVVFSVSKTNALRAQKILDEAISQIVSLANEGNQERQNVMCFSSQLFSLLNPNQGSSL